MSKRKWTSEEDQYIKDNFGKTSFKAMAQKLNCQIATVEHRAEVLGLNVTHTRVPRWSEEEVNKLREYANIYTTEEIAQMFGKSIVAVQKKALKLGIELHSKPDPWEDWMIDYLKENINRVPIGKIQDKLGLSYHQIVRKCKKLGIEYITENWTDEEIETLRKYAPTCHYTELTKVLPRRSVGAISAKAYELGIETISDYAKLNDEHREFIKENWDKLTATEIARRLKINTSLVYRYKKELGLPNKGQKKKWTPKKIDKLRTLAKTKTISELAKTFKCTNQAISTIAHKNNIELIDSKNIWNELLDEQLKSLCEQGLIIADISKTMQLNASLIRKRIDELGLKPKINKKHQNWTEEEVQILTSLYQEVTLAEIATILGRNETQVRGKARKLGLSFPKNNHSTWTKEDTSTLIELHDKYDVSVIAQMMGYKEATISSKAIELGITLKYAPRKRWSKEEVKVLTNYAREYSNTEIAILLNRSVASVSSKLTELGLKAKRSDKFWSEEEEMQLALLAKTHEVAEIAEIMHKSYVTIINKMYKMGLKVKVNFTKRWTNEDDETLKMLLDGYSTFDVAQILDRSEDAVKVRAKKLGIITNVRNWTKEEETMLADLWGNEPIEKIAQKLNRTASSLINRAVILGLGSQISNNYDGLIIQNIADMFHIQRERVLTDWVALGLKISYRRISANQVYAYVTIPNLLEFLEKNKNIWDSRWIEVNIFGKEPDWLQEKRKRDIDSGDNQNFGMSSLTRQQLILDQSYYLDNNQDESISLTRKK